MKSRALPDDFDIIQAMKSPPRGLSQRTTSSNWSFVCSVPTCKGSEYFQPLIVEDVTPQKDNGTILPISMDSRCNNIYTHPISMVASAGMSSTTPIDESVPFDVHAVSQVRNRRQPDPFGGSSSPPSLYHSPSQMYATPIPSHGQQGRAKLLGSPLRSSISCCEFPCDYGNALMPTAAASVYSVQKSQPGQYLPGDECPQSGVGTAAPCRVDPVPTSFQNVTDDQAGCLPADGSVVSRSLGIDYPPSLNLHPSSKPHLDRQNLEHGRQHQGLHTGLLAAPEDFQLRQINFRYPTAFNSEYSVSRDNPAVYAWEDPEPYGFTQDLDMHSLQHPPGNFDGIYCDVSFSLPDCNSGRPKSFTYGTTYF